MSPDIDSFLEWKGPSGPLLTVWIRDPREHPPIQGAGSPYADVTAATAFSMRFSE